MVWIRALRLDGKGTVKGYGRSGGVRIRGRALRGIILVRGRGWLGLCFAIGGWCRVMWRRLILGGILAIV